jgi:hypothetical protein
MKNKFFLKCAFGFTLCSIQSYVLSYELVTHSALTRQATDQSRLAITATKKKLGIQEGAEPFGKNYYDFLGNLVVSRPAAQFEGEIIERSGELNKFSLRGWLMRGAIREDDGASTYPSYILYADSDPYGISGGRNRYCNHFLDPITRNGYSPPLSDPLSLVFCPSNYSAPNWALGTSDAFAANPTADSGFRNHFSIFNAREAMWRALTLKASVDMTRRNDDA